MKTKRNVVQICLLGALLLARPDAVTALTITDSFTNAANWGAPLIVQGTANMSVGSGRMNYTSTSTNNSGTGIPRNWPLLPTTQDWSLKVDAHLAPFTLTKSNQWSDLFLGVGKNGDFINTHLAFEFGRGYWGNPAHNGYYIQDDSQINGVFIQNKLFEVWSNATSDVSLKMSYSAANHTITYYFDKDGAANGYNWMAQGVASIASGTYNMNLSDTDTFTLGFFGSSGSQTVAVGQAYLSNLEISGDTTFSGHVYCSCDGSPVTNSVVKLGTNFLATTDSAGSYSFTNVPPGTNIATVTAPRFGIFTNSVVIPSNAFVATNDFYLTNLTLVFYPKFDSSITNDSNAATITNSIKSALQRYEQYLANPICVTIFFAKTNTGSSGSLWSQAAFPYSRYLTNLQANSKQSAYDRTALATLPAGPSTGINNNTDVWLTAANLAAIGEIGPSASLVSSRGGLYGTIFLNISQMNISRLNQNPNLYDLQTAVEHEVGEILGIGGSGSSLSLSSAYAGQSSPTDGVGPLDFFRYRTNGVRSFTLDTNLASYFSIDGGTDRLVYFNQLGFANGNRADFGDWGDGGIPATANTNHPPQVQDAFGARGWMPDVGANELIALDVIGYTLNVTPPVVQNATIAANNFTFGWNTLPGQLYQVQFATNLTGNAWNNLGGPITASNMTGVVSETNAFGPKGFYRVIALPP